LFAGLGYTGYIFVHFGIVTTGPTVSELLMLPILGIDEQFIIAFQSSGSMFPIGSGPLSLVSVIPSKVISG
jgi:hypothetical protein